MTEYCVTVGKEKHKSGAEVETEWDILEKIQEWEHWY